MDETPVTEPLRYAVVATSLCELTVVARGEAIVGIWFPNPWHPPAASAYGEKTNESADPVIADAARQVREYLAGARRAFQLDVRTEGDAFSESVWMLLREIPYGTTTTYGALAERLGGKQLSQRVGQAVGRNPVSIVVPCHRVLGADGSLTGFGGGLDTKRALLALEEPDASETSRLF